MENEPTKLDRILQAMDPEDRERAVKLLQLFLEKKKEWESMKEQKERSTNINPTTISEQ